MDFYEITFAIEYYFNQFEAWFIRTLQNMDII